MFHVFHTHLPGLGPAHLIHRILEALSNLSTYLNAAGAEKLHFPRWLISAILAEINHLQTRSALSPSTARDNRFGQALGANEAQNGQKYQT
jgi:hypothetical protein